MFVIPFIIFCICQDTTYCISIGDDSVGIDQWLKHDLLERMIVTIYSYFPIWGFPHECIIAISPASSHKLQIDYRILGNQY